jgi:hypothetical protein
LEEKFDAGICAWQAQVEAQGQAQVEVRKQADI